MQKVKKLSKYSMKIICGSTSLLPSFLPSWFERMIKKSIFSFSEESSGKRTLCKWFLRKFHVFSAPKDEFRKPSWIDVSDTDDELFDGKSKFLFQIFTNPIELQKHFDNQMQQVLKSMKELENTEDVFEPPTKDDYLKPGFDEHFMEQFRKSSISDTDLDGEIYADQLHSLLQRIQPDVKEKINKKDQKLVGFSSFVKPKMTDEQKIFGRIHGSIVDEENNKPIRRKDVAPRMPPHFGGVFEGAYQVRIFVNRFWGDFSIILIDNCLEFLQCFTA